MDELVKPLCNPKRKWLVTKAHKHGVWKQQVLFADFDIEMVFTAFSRSATPFFFPEEAQERVLLIICLNHL